MIYEVKHPLVEQKLTVLRDKNTHDQLFREKTSEITMLIAYEAMKNLKTEEVEVETPIKKSLGSKIYNDIVLVPVLRAGLGMLNAMLNLIPCAKVGFAGLYRDHKTKEPVVYYEKFPENLKSPKVYILDPMLATGGSLSKALDILKEKGFSDLSVISILSSPEGIEVLKKNHPDVSVFTGSIDECLNDDKYIVPGLGDAGDRLFGTK